MIATEGQPFHDAEADAALFDGAARAARPSKVEVHELDADVNDPAFALAMADRLHELIEACGDDAGQRRSRGCARRSTPAGRSSAPAPAPGSPRSAPRRAAADLIIIYNSGRYRMAGRGSLAGLMPYGDANAIVVEMAARGAAGRRSETPVLAGVCGTDPFRLMPVFLDELKRIGFTGVQNFPTVGPDRRHLPAEPRGDRAWATASRWR